MRAFILIISVFASLSVHAQHARPIQAKLQKATVYLQGAYLYYNDHVSVAPGSSDIVFENISPMLNSASLQANCKGAIVMDVRHNLKYKEKPVTVHRLYDREIALMLDSLEELSYDEKDIRNKQKVLESERNMLLNSKVINSERDSLALLRDGMAFLKEKLNSIYEQELRWERSMRKLEKKKKRMNDRYQALLLLQNGQERTGSDAQPVHQVIVTIYSESAGNVQLNFHYFVQQASWQPYYEMQATSTSGNLQLKYFAHLTQSSGIDWKNIPLTLSTSNPNEGNIKPELNPWYLSFMEYKRRPEAYMSNGAMSIERESEVNDMSARKKMESKDDMSIVNYVAVTQNLIRTEYEIKLNYMIQSDGKQHKVMISQRDVPMQLQFAAVPKVCTDAFLMARVSGWEDMKIIPGQSRLYFDGTFVGQIYLNASTTSDTLDMNLGRDKTIAITRKKIQEKYKEAFIGDEKVETRSMELVVRNTKNMPVEIMVEDQIPVVNGTSDIKVVLKDGDGAEVEPHTGKLKWRLKLNSRDSKKIVFTYEIHYPKSKGIAGL